MCMCICVVYPSLHVETCILISKLAILNSSLVLQQLEQKYIMVVEGCQAERYKDYKPAKTKVDCTSLFRGRFPKARKSNTLLKCMQRM